MAGKETVPMVSEQIMLQSTLELATFGEVIYAFSALRSTSGRRRGTRATAEVMPWGETLAGVDVQCEVAPPPRRAMAPAQHLEAAPIATAKPRRTSGRCTCGQCRNCMENARWERIFQEKF